MAYQIRGKLEVIYPTDTIQGKSGNPFYRRTFVLDCTRFNPDTGEPWENHPQFELGGSQCALLDNFQLGQRVEVSFSLRGAKYQDKTTGEWKYFTSVSAFDIKPVMEQAQNVQNVQQPTYQQQVADARLSAARTAINNGAPVIQQPVQQYPQQQGGQQQYVQTPQYTAPSNRGANAQGPKDDLPF